MSRTYRRSKVFRKYTNKETYLKQNNPHKRGKTHTTDVVYKTDEKYKSDLLEAEKKFQIELELYHKSEFTYRSGYYFLPFPRHEYVSKIEKYVKREMDENDFINEIREDEQIYIKSFRDGKYSESKIQKDFKQTCNRITRRANKKFCSDVMKNFDYEDKVYPHPKETDFLFWCFW